MAIKTENEMTDEELEQLEEAQKAEPSKEEIALDLLEDLRKLLNNSRVEQMYVIKRASKLRSNCSYYKAARKLFIKDELTKISLLLETIDLSEIDKDG